MTVALIDFSQIVISNIMQHYRTDPAAINDRSEGIKIIRPMVVNSLRRIATVVRSRGDRDVNLVICCDSPYVWRRDVFPLYKAVRVKSKAKDQFDWRYITDCINQIAGEFVGVMPYKIVSVSKMEADDIINVLARSLGENPFQSVVIVSRDKDLKQAMFAPNVTLYNPIDDVWTESVDSPSLTVRQVLSGDVRDGVPNVLSDDDTFINEKKRQRSLGDVRLNQLMTNHGIDIAAILTELATKKDEFSQEMHDNLVKNYERNDQLINLQRLPDRHRIDIIAAYNAAPCGSRRGILTYLAQHGLSNMLGQLSEF